MACLDALAIMAVHALKLALSWGGCGPAEGDYLGLSEIAQRGGMSLCVVGASFCHSFSSTASAISGMLSLRRVLRAVQLGDMRPGMGRCGRLAANVMGALLAMRPHDRELVPPSADRFGFACPFSEGK